MVPNVKKGAEDMTLIRERQNIEQPPKTSNWEKDCGVKRIFSLKKQNKNKVE